MKSKLITRAAAGFAACALAVSLTACGGTGDIRNSEEPVSASQAFGTKGLWFDTVGEVTPGKDQSIQAILAFDGEGNVTHYDTDGLDFSDLKDLSDEEVLDLAKKQDKKNFDKYIKDRLKDIDAAIEDVDGWVASAQAELDAAVARRANMAYVLECEEALAEAPAKAERASAYLQERRTETESFEYSEPKPVPYTLSIETDDTGNNAAEESINYTIPGITTTKSDDTVKGIDPLKTYENDQKHNLTTSVVSPSPTVYEKRYSGYFEGGLWTQVGEKFSTFTMDSPDTEGIEVD